MNSLENHIGAKAEAMETVQKEALPKQSAGGSTNVQDNNTNRVYSWRRKVATARKHGIPVC